MDIRHCKKCGQMFQYNGTPLCDKCEHDMEEKFNKVKEYVRENPGASMGIVSEENEVPIQQIKRWIREERLAFTKESGVMLHCEKCGSPIYTGRYCKACKGSMVNRLSGMYTEKKPQQTGKSAGDSNAKMRFLGK